MEILAGEDAQEAVERGIALRGSILEGGCEVDLLEGIGDAGGVWDG